MKKIIYIVLLAASLTAFYPEELAFAQSRALRNVETLILQDAYVQAASQCRKTLAHSHRASVRAKGYYLLGVCLLKQSRFSEARKNFSKILKRYPRSKFCAQAKLAIADSFLLAADFKSAGREYEQFLRDYSRSPLAIIAREHLEQCQQGKPYSNAYFSVQVGCFLNKKNAEGLRNELIDSGFQAYLLELPSDRLYRVCVGKLNNKFMAKSLEQRLKKAGYPTKIYP